MTGVSDKSFCDIQPEKADSPAVRVHPMFIIGMYNSPRVILYDALGETLVTTKKSAPDNPAIISESIPHVAVY